MVEAYDPVSEAKVYFCMVNFSLVISMTKRAILLFNKTLLFFQFIDLLKITICLLQLANVVFALEIPK